MKRVFTNLVALLVLGISLGVGATLIFLLTLQDRDRIDRSSTIEVDINTEINDLSSGTTDNVELSGKRTLFDKLDQISFLQHKFERNAALYSLVAPLDQPSVENLLAQSLDAQWKLSKDTRTELQTVLLERFSMLSQTDALEFVLDHRKSGAEFNAALISIFKDSATSNFDATIAKAKTLPDESRRRALQGILQAVEDQPLIEQRKLATSLNLEAYFVKSYLASLNLDTVDDPSLVWAAVIDVAEQAGSFVTQLGELGIEWYRKIGIEALDQMGASMKNDAVEEKVFALVLSFIAQTEPKLAFDYAVTQLSGNIQSNVVTDVVREWTTQNPLMAFEAVNGLDATAVREQLQFTVISHWAVQDPDYVLDNLSDFPRPLQRFGAVTAIGTITSKSPELAVSRLLEIEDAYTKLEAAHTLVSIWSRVDLEAAHLWVLEEPAISNISRYLFEPIVSRLVATDPVKALELARKHPLSQGQVGFEAEVLQAIAFQDMQVALDLLSKVRAGQRNFAYGAIGSVYVRNGEYQKAVDLGLELGESAHSDYYQYISYIWVNTDPDKLYERVCPKFRVWVG
ncbi:MAG: hypothetical protein F4Z14_08825 [Gammaproteobacteria bacterium]|nr:hypothetical protein [Gammaproteobacteria bacterium]